jgi:hypothetical protein
LLGIRHPTEKEKKRKKHVFPNRRCWIWYSIEQHIIPYLFAELMRVKGCGEAKFLHSGDCSQQEVSMNKKVNSAQEAEADVVIGNMEKKKS